MKNTEQIEQMIDRFMESNDFSELRKLKGKISGMAPYGDEELGKAINVGNEDDVRNIIKKRTTIQSKNFAEGDDANADAKAQEVIESVQKAEAKQQDTDRPSEETLNAERAHAQNQQNQKNDNKLFKELQETAEAHRGKGIGNKRFGGSKMAQRDYDYYTAMLNSQKANQAEDKAYIDAKMKKLDAYNKSDTSEPRPKSRVQFNKKTGRGNTMDISKKDLNKIMTAMKTINKHFAEEDAVKKAVAEAETINDNIGDTEDTMNEETDGNVYIKLDEDTRQEMIKSLVNADIELDNITAKPDYSDAGVEDEEEVLTEDEVEADEDEDEDETEAYDEDDEDDEDEESVEVDACGGTDFSAFSEALTNTVLNLNNKVDSLTKRINYSMDESAENFSLKEFQNFADNVAVTLRNISARVNMLSDKVHSGKITTNLDYLKKTANAYEDDFIMDNGEVKADKTVGDGLPVVEHQFAERAERVKDFFNL